MDKGTVAGQQLTLFAASDDQEARAAALEMGKAIGFDAVDAGPLSNARQLEALGYFNIQLGFVLGNGTDVGFKSYIEISTKSASVCLRSAFAGGAMDVFPALVAMHIAYSI